MKKLKLIALCSVLLTAQANADTILGGSVELAGWQQKQEMNFDKQQGQEVNFMGSVSLEHMIPLIPNLKIRQSAVNSHNFSYVKRDYIGYYEILDNNTFELDTGIGYSSLDNAKVDDASIHGGFPFLYARAQAQILNTNVAIFAEGTQYKQKHNHAGDIEAGLRYVFNEGVKVELETGYRVQDNNITHKVYGLPIMSKAFVNRTSGFFAGVYFDF